MKNSLPRLLQRLDRQPVTLRTLALALGGYALLVALSLFSSNPFLDGVAEITSLGDWDPEQVQFQGGSYGYRLLYAVAEVDVLVATDRGPVPAHLEMWKLPIVGWSVNRFERGR
jgi:hypothetical protein